MQERIEYARGFTISYSHDFTELTVRDPLDTSKILAVYHLYKDSALYQAADDAVTNILISIKNIACLSTTHLGFLEALHLEKTLVAFSGTKYIYSPVIQQMVKNGEVQEMGNEGDLNAELLVQLHPDLIMSYNIGNEGYDHFEKMRTLHLKPVLNNEYLELSPLGQAEWIKFVAAFFDQEETANKIFDSIVSDYNNEIKKVQSEKMPTVFTGLAFKGEWTVSGGKSFAAEYLRSAGADYIWSDDDRTGNFPVSLEEVIARADSADFWVHPGGAESLDDIKKSDVRYTHFAAWQNGDVYNNNNRISEGGGNDYWESGVISPQIILQDLIKIFHPELEQDHAFVYYKQLQ